LIAFAGTGSAIAVEVSLVGLNHSDQFGLGKFAGVDFFGLGYGAYLCELHDRSPWKYCG
jgi:hypothetical protein